MHAVLHYVVQLLVRLREQDASGSGRRARSVVRPFVCVFSLLLFSFCFFFVLFYSFLLSSSLPGTVCPFVSVAPMHRSLHLFRVSFALYLTQSSLPVSLFISFYISHSLLRSLIRAFLDALSAELVSVDGAGKKGLTAVGQLLPSVLHTCVMKRLTLLLYHVSSHNISSAYGSHTLASVYSMIVRFFPLVIYTRAENAFYRVRARGSCNHIRILNFSVPGRSTKFACLSRMVLTLAFFDNAHRGWHI